MRYPRFMIAAPASGSGKTLITCGILQALVNRKWKPASFKCGPDYIDPLFHTKVIGTPSRNLDTFFTPTQTVRYLFGRQAAQADVSVMEGVMGFYDGVGGVTAQASSWELADVTDTPVILVINAKGMSLSAVPLIQGFLEFCPQGERAAGTEHNSHIQGVILNQISPAVYPGLKETIEAALPVQVFGYVPRVEDCVIESRHLGLVTPDEIAGLRDKLNKLAEVLEKTLDLDAILQMASEAPDLDCAMPSDVREAVKTYRVSVGESRTGAGNACELSETEEENTRGVSETMPPEKKLRIAVARDEAFCFYYEDNLELLRTFGAELIFFSPVHDKELPSNIQGLLLGGGYPELYAGQLSANDFMLASIRRAVRAGLPYLAECGGFLYLHDTMEDMQGKIWPMAGIIHGHVCRTDRLTRFGYVTLTANRPQIFGESGCSIRAHEFHYFDSSENGDAFHARKPGSGRSWDCMVAGDCFAAGFPHLYYYSNPEFAARFLRQCRLTASQTPVSSGEKQ
ncbi:MAG: cobyrinate a,c-diamide synthase [Clostridiales bacterium]|nr:cobyrinate a,c-diamide synthase [Clostridiales bacterium]